MMVSLWCVGSLVQSGASAFPSDVPAFLSNVPVVNSNVCVVNSDVRVVHSAVRGVNPIDLKTPAVLPPVAPLNRPRCPVPNAAAPPNMKALLEGMETGGNGNRALYLKVGGAKQLNKADGPVFFWCHAKRARQPVVWVAQH